MIKATRIKTKSAQGARRNKELVRELKYLRSTARDVLVRHSIKINARLADMARILDSRSGNMNKARKPNDKVMGQMLSCIHSLRVKPKKGRAKDLLRIESIVKKLDDLMPSQP